MFFFSTFFWIISLICNEQYRFQIIVIKTNKNNHLNSENYFYGTYLQYLTCPEYDRDEMRIYWISEKFLIQNTVLITVVPKY